MASDNSVLYIAKAVRSMTGTNDIGKNAILVKGQKIAAVGPADELRRQYRECEVVDFGEGVITPGLSDSHSHVISGAISDALGVDLTGAMTFDEVCSRLREYMAELSDDDWVLAWGLDPTVYDGGPLEYRPFAETIGDRCAMISFADMHSLLASPKALQAAGIDGPRDFPASSAKIACYPDGTPTGHVLEFQATSLVRAAMPPLSDEQKKRNIWRVLQEMAATGLTKSHVMDLDAEHVRLLREMEEEGELPVKLELHPFANPVTVDGVEAEYQRLMSLVGLRGRRWAVTGVKFFMDGSIDGGTAWLREPDIHGQSDHGAWSDQQAYRSLMTKLVESGISTVTHAIGDEGVLTHVDVVEGLLKHVGDINGGKHGTHSIEHLEMLEDDEIQRIASSDIYLSMMPLHCTRFLHADQLDNWSRKLDDVRKRDCFRTRSLVNAGAVVAIGSDWPVAPFDPRWTMADGMLRRPYDHPEMGPVEPQEALISEELLAGYTVNCAMARGESTHAGKIAVGYDADFTVFGQDPLALEPSALAVDPILATVVDGELAYQA